MSKKEVVFSGIKPSGELHLGNYLGSIKPSVQMQESGKHETYFCVVDEHAITVPQNPEDLHKRTLEIAMWYMAAGIDPEKSVLFLQSMVPAHTELSWILTTLTPMGELQRMTQYKDYIAKGKSAFAGLFNYPVLMASDILLYQTSIVPVGEDQLQHIELTRAIGERFNNRFGQTFVIPKGIISSESARIKSLQNPAEKMSKSDENSDSYIGLTDSPEDIKKKIKRAVTDSGNEIKIDIKNKPAITNLIQIFSSVTGLENKKIEEDYREKTYSQFKEGLAEAVAKHLEPIQKKFFQLKKNPSKVENILRKNSVRAEKIANKTLNSVKEKMGFLL